ncbi:Stk1 family PASTA domain-containing Ser/Thr kinase [Periweissella cryptocerci]|uniref:non-specific serine/threonine protein kinase n=1 Tax=Periweissella cryptocerci TaxID=2506420 RepID=A0A4V1AIF0_9LACO|nr:Stk1 family PASTA domain-containing Ser/Thr kinase [Periweissella cryptocerci]QBO35275.1 Stk1 family PASTA domain-containing Ser/Thr kinase [Periweissella cryptocerci]
MMPNQLVGGRYQIVRALGEGGMANVYLAHDLILDRDVSLKTLRLDLATDDNTIRRFQREAMAATELVHPNIVSMYDFGEDQGIQYLVMEYVDGMDLKTYIQTNFPISHQRVIDMMEQVLSAVSAAHAGGIIHRDLKPQNILIDKQGNAKISDFGIATSRSEKAMTQTNTILGSVHYLSPEQARGGMATDKSDVYSLGIILYEMLTGRVPFEGENAVAVALKHSQDEMPSVRAYDSRIPQAMENVVLKATAKDPADRYNSVDEMGDDLRTSLLPTRADEPVFVPTSQNDTATKIIPVGDIQDATSIPKPISPIESAEPKTVDDVMQDKKKSHKGLWIFSIILVILLAGGLTSYFVIKGMNASVPNLVGKTQENAVALIQDNGLKVGTITKTTSQTVESGRVISSDPKFNSELKKGATVNILVSAGRKLLRFGDYSNEKYSSVASTLKKKGFKVKEKQQDSDSVPEGVILSQDVNAEKRVDPERTTVTFTVSSGPKKITVPDFKGKTTADFYNWANENNIKILQPDSESSESVAEGKIIKQSITAGKTAIAGDTMQVTTSTGPKKIPVTSLKGMSLTNAKKWAKNNKLTLIVKYEKSEDVAKNHVIDQSPVSGHQVIQGDSVSVIVSSGAPKKEEPASSNDDEDSSSSTPAADSTSVTESSQTKDGNE